MSVNDDEEDSSLQRRSRRHRIHTRHLTQDQELDASSAPRNKPGKSLTKPDDDAKATSDGQKSDVKTTRVNLLVKKTYDRVRKRHKEKKNAEIKDLWIKNFKTINDGLNCRVKNTVQTPVDTEDLISAFEAIANDISLASDQAKTLITSKSLKIKICKNSRNKSKQFSYPAPCYDEHESYLPIVTIPSVERIPPVYAWTSIPYNIHEDDGKFLTNIPFLGDEVIDRDKKFIDEMVNLYGGRVHGENNCRFGFLQDDALFAELVKDLMEIEKQRGVETFIDEYAEGGVSSEPSTKPNNYPSMLIFQAISSTFKGSGSVHDLRDRYISILKSKKSEPPAKPSLLKSGIVQQDPASYFIPNIEGPHAKDLPKESSMHAYQFLFCRRCYQYDCSRGHNGDDQIDLKRYRKSQNPQSSFHPSMYVCELENCYLKNKESDDCISKGKEEILAEWTPGDKSMFRCLFSSFPSHCYVANLMMNKTCRQVRDFANLQNEPTVDEGNSEPQPGTSKNLTSPPDMENISDNSQKTTLASKRKSKPWNKKSSSVNKKNLARRWINNVKRYEKSSGGIKTGGVLPSRFMPCHHGEMECDEKNPNCYCGKNGTSCEKFCSCPTTCKRRFPGCRCTSTCDSKRCVCFVAARECDPDLCRLCGASDHNIDNMTCRNVNIQKRLHKHLLMGKSDVAGWGIFIKEEAQKGDFIAEYRGEIISHDESERRGHVYDKIQHTFLFELNDHFVVDATRKGNKARFVNSSKSPNCEVKRMLVNGDHRIGIYAKRYIEAGEELFYDYEDVLEKQQRVAAASAIAASAT